MMVKDKIIEGGAKKSPLSVVVMDQHQRRNGRCLENLIPLTHRSLQTIELNLIMKDLIANQGAQLSEGKASENIFR